MAAAARDYSFRSSSSIANFSRYDFPRLNFSADGFDARIAVSVRGIVCISAMASAGTNTDVPAISLEEVLVPLANPASDTNKGTNKMARCCAMSWEVMKPIRYHKLL